MKPNVLKFKNDIKAQVAKYRETGSCDWWMHPAYCAYYILRHNVENSSEFIEEDIKKSYKALPDCYKQSLFKKIVNNFLEDYAETLCTD